jgi:hypothetical protein
LTEDDFGEAMQLWEADAYLLSFPSYLLLLEKARLIGNMFHMTWDRSWHSLHGWGEHVRKDEETLPVALCPLERNQHSWRIKEVRRAFIFLTQFFS